MEIYTKKDLELFENKIDDIIKKLEEREKQLMLPEIEEKRKLEIEVLNYVKEHKRKIYGGYAQNKLISAKDPKDAFYEEDAIADLDFYSPEPIEDLIRLSNVLHKKGYKYVKAQEATHKETYSIFVNFDLVCDISYVPKNVFHRIPFVELKGINYVHPSFIMIDLYRMFTDPIGSGSFRWKKTFPRLYLLQKHYPFNKATAKVPQSKTVMKDPAAHKKLLDKVYDFIVENNKTLIVYGNYAYNKYLEASGIEKDSNVGKKYKPLDIDSYEIISTNYREDGVKLLKMLKSSTKADDISIVEYYPFWQFMGYSAVISYNNVPLVTIVHYNRKCLPIKKVDNINLAAFDLTLLMSITLAFRARVQRNEETYQFHNIMTSHLVEMRNYYFKKTGKTMFDETLFEEFVVDCIGTSVDPQREALIERNAKAKQKDRKGPIVFRYDPSDGVKEPKSTYVFSNSSGNSIKNPSNFRIIETDKAYAKPRDSRAIEEVIEDIQAEPEAPVEI
jgi:hypothetical protein